MKPDGIEASVQSSAISLALLGIPVATDDLKEEDLVVEIVETGSTGNLNLCWKLKQMLGITVITGNCSVLLTLTLSVYLDCSGCVDLVKTII